MASVQLISAPQLPGFWPEWARQTLISARVALGLSEAINKETMLVSPAFASSGVGDCCPICPHTMGCKAAGMWRTNASMAARVVLCCDSQRHASTSIARVMLGGRTDEEKRCDVCDA